MSVLRTYKIAIATIINGVFFLIPIGILFIILEKIYHLLHKLLIALHIDFSQKTFLYVFLNNLTVILFILLLCFFAGLLARLKFGKQLVTWLEHNVLNVLPGYDYVKGIVEDMFGISDHNFQEVILYRKGDDFQLGFKVESVTHTRAMIFIPGVPKPRSGAMFIVNKSEIISTRLTSHQAIVLMRNMGSGSGALLSSYINENSYVE